MDPIKETAEELGLPEEQVYIVVQDLWNGVKYYLYNPHLIKWGILLPYFRIDLKIFTIKKYIADVIEKKNIGQPKTKAGLEYWDSLLENLPNGNSSRKKRTKRSLDRRLYRGEAVREPNGETV